MKKISIFQLLFLCIALNLAANTTNLTVQLQGYNANSQKNFASIINSDVNYPFEEQVKISDDGTLSLSLVIEHTQEILLSYDGREIPIIISSGDDLKLTIKIPKSLSNNKIALQQNEGLNKELNKLIFEYNPILEDWIAKSYSASKYRTKKRRCQK